jgi:hypothetical protein
MYPRGWAVTMASLDFDDFLLFMDLFEVLIDLI